jgi:adenosylcobinamide-phosphate synthase
MMLRAVVCLLALGLDGLLGEPRRGHPLVGFGRLADALEGRWNSPGQGSRLRGVVALLVLLIPVLIVALLAMLYLPLAILVAVDVLLLYLALGLASLGTHARAVTEPLSRGDLPEARLQVARMVSRDTEQLDENGVAAAATESVLENGADAVFASLFWYLLAGLPGVLVHRLVNTLDAMWGYRNERFARFGWAAAHLDDLLGWIPARLTALSYALVGQTGRGLRCWRRQGRLWSSPNAGPVMAAGAGALALTLGGPAPYHGGWQDRPVLGEGATADAHSPDRAMTLLRRSVFLWLAIILSGAAAWYWSTVVA